MDDAARGGDYVPGHLFRWGAKANLRATRYQAVTDLSTPEDREATRYLAAATIYDSEFAERVVRKTVKDPHRALAPTHGADTTIVVRWALASIRARLLFDFAQLFLLAFVAFAVRAGMPWTVVLALVLVAGALVSVDRWWRVYHILSKNMLKGRFSYATAPAPRSSRTRRHLSEIASRKDGNLVVFRGHHTFVGCGELHDDQLLSVDISTGSMSKKGKRRTPVKFSNGQLHQAVLTALDGLRLEGLTTRHVLFVNGAHLHEEPHLSGGPLGRPLTRIPPEQVWAATDHPTPFARAYVCAEIPAWHGQLCVTVMVRAMQSGSMLFIEWSTHVLPPVGREYLDIDWLSQPTVTALGSYLVKSAARWTLPSLVGAPFRIGAYGSRWLTLARRSSRQSHAIARGRVFDYGASRSIREDAAGRARTHHFLAVDERVYLRVVQDCIGKTLTKFLKDHKISTGKFEGKAYDHQSEVRSEHPGIADRRRWQCRRRQLDQRSLESLVRARSKGQEGKEHMKKTSGFRIRGDGNVVGDGSSSRVTRSEQITEVSIRIRDFARAVEAHPSDVDVPGVDDALRELEREAHKSEPDADVLTGLLARISAAVARVASLTGALDNIRTSLRHLL